jgi:hypothetical protein
MLFLRKKIRRKVERKNIEFASTSLFFVEKIEFEENCVRNSTFWKRVEECRRKWKKTEGNRRKK